MMNKIVLMGRMTADPETHTGNNMMYTRFTLAVERNYKSKDGDRVTDFIRCTAWNGTAEFIDKYFHKGSMVAVCGELNIDEYEDKDGNTRTTANVRVSEVSFTGDKSGIENDTKPTYPKNKKGYR